MRYHHGILELTLTSDPKEPLADPGLIPLDKCVMVFLLSCKNGDIAPQLASLVVPTVDTTAGPPTAPSLS